MAAHIELPNGCVTIVDDDDYEAVSRFNWFACPSAQSAKKWSVYRTAPDGERPRSIYLHRSLLNAPQDMQVDHINGDPLDNRRSNLRLCTQAQNNANRDAPPSQSGYRGVHPGGVGWRAQIEVEGRLIRTNNLPTREMAARVYNALAREFHGEFARLNDIPDHPPGGHSHEG